MSRRRGFTLIELMVAMSIAMFLAGICVTSFVQVRKLIKRSESRMAMYESAQGIFTKLTQSLGQLQQHCALVVNADANGIELVFMRGKEDQWDWKGPRYTRLTTDLVWERWYWNKAKGILYQSSSSPQRNFNIQLPGYQNQSYVNLPQPRRYLDPANPLLSTSAQGGLDGNLYFPHAGSAVPGDLGDYSDLTNQAVPVLRQVTDLTLQLVPQGYPTQPIITASGQAVPSPNPVVLQGVWMDGRISDDLSVAPTSATYDASAIAKRPKLVRLMFTLTDVPAGQSPAAVDNRLVQTFSFSFALPGLAGAP